MTSPEQPGAAERRLDLEKDTEPTRRMLGALGYYDASQDEYKDPDHIDSQWQQPETD